MSNQPKLDWNEIARYEQAIGKKYGQEAVDNLRSYWNDEKEEVYLEQLKLLKEKDQYTWDKERKVFADGFFITEKLLTRESSFIPCPICNKADNNAKDDFCIKKYDCCYTCYVQWVEDREERWKSGWRPNKNGNNT